VTPRCTLSNRAKVLLQAGTESRTLHKTVVSVLASALECCLNPLPDFTGPQFRGLPTLQLDDSAVRKGRGIDFFVLIAREREP
jgi:hypothetical protein